MVGDQITDVTGRDAKHLGCLRDADLHSHKGTGSGTDVGILVTGVRPLSARLTLYHLVEHEQIPYRRLGTVILLPAAWVEREPTMPVKRR
ncbi:hypothetical protein CSO01_31290 [Cellulomonas soli]|uniref:Uncharacterized protein n=1 Tax=Cellulomonas soli TaxID=931535 RepID=A0A512PGT4_9CELL|nr:hypothetical protein CSO01_31290 [Cellulomonas soli]